MSKRYDDSQTYVARILGASGDTVQLAAAADAILAATQEWNLRHDFSYLLMDTSGGFTVASVQVTIGLPTASTSVANGFAGVNVGQTITGTGIPVGTTVLSIESTTSLTMSQNASASNTSTRTFSADIPVIAGTDTYNLPTPFGRPYSARLLTNDVTLEFKEQREIDKAFWTQSNSQIPSFYNLFNTSSFAVGRQNGKVRLFPSPSGTDTLRVRYYRPIAEPSAASDLLDMPDVYVYAFLELARYYYLKDHDAESVRLQETKERAELLYRQVMARDEQGTEDKDMALVPQMEHAPWRNLDSSDIRLVT